MYKDENIINFLKKRDGIETVIELINGKKFSVWNIAWGYDHGDEFAHITTNISPNIKSTEIHVFYSNEIKQINSNPVSTI